MTSKKIKTVQKLKADFYELMKLHKIITHEMVGTLPSKKKYWMGKEQIFSAKLVSHLYSAIYLTEGTYFDIENNQYKIFDKSSIAVILRAAFETYLTFNFIYVTPKKNVNEMKFRYLSWVYSDLFFSKYFISDAKIEEKEIEKERILKLLEQISIYKSLPQNEKTQILKGNWRIGKSWTDIAISSGLKDEFFIKIYKFLCSHSHTGSHSIKQINMNFDIEQEKERIVTPLSICILILCKFIIDYCTIHQKARIKLNNSKPGKNLIDYYLSVLSFLLE